MNDLIHARIRVKNYVNSRSDISAIITRRRTGCRAEVFEGSNSDLQPSAFGSRLLRTRNTALNNLEVFGLSKNDWKMSCTTVL
jgi:hypothetical protein